MSHVPSFIYKDINNGVTTATKGMPQKSSTSDGTSTFAMGRMSYVNMFTNIQSTQQMNKKKWLGGGNRDASQIIANRRNAEIGKGTLNLPINPPNKTSLSFTNGNDKNLINSTLHRVRGGGTVPPPKKNASPSHTYVPSPGIHPYLQPGYSSKNTGNFPFLRYNK